MRRTSAKTLSLAISLLLAISVLFSLSLPVWAETETVPGDLNGDTLVNAEDIAILEAVLDGSQADAADGKYDISGNKMVDSKDLIVLKNLADPSAPALADKLADGITDDTLTLVASVEGGVLQSAVVRGNSTKALELNGNTLTVRFAKVQNWSSKGILEMDTLWVSGSQEVTVSLLDADGDVLGTAGTASAKDAGWSRIRVPLSGVADRAEIGGFTVTVSADAHMYMDNLFVDISDEYKITRAEMENALVEMAWNWYFKGSAYEYDSVSLNSLEQHMNYPLSGYSGGKSRLTLFPTLEDATSHSSVFTVCSGFAYDMYLTALGYPILGSKLNSLTMTFWRNSSYYPGNVRDAEGAYDMAILRWHDMGQGTVYYEYDEQFSNYYKDENGNIVYNNWYDKAAVKEFFENYEENFRPGDIIVADHPGHTIIYIGNGMVMDVNGGRFNPITDKMEGLGGKYDMTTGVEKGEAYGCVSYRSFEGYFLTPNGAGKTWLDRRLDYPEDGSGKLLESGTLEHNHLVVIRPLNLLTIDDGDNDPSNDKLNPEYKLNTGLLKYQLEHDVSHEVKTSGYHIDEVTQTRLNYPGMNIDRTVNITPYGTAVKGDTITYTVAITNNSNDAQYVAFKGDGYQPKAYEGLTVVEHIPANTVLAAAPGATVEGDTLTWKVTVPAGETVELSYTVTVTGEIGDKIVCGGGWVNNIPSNTIENIIGGKKLPADAMADFSTDGITITDSTNFAEQVYKVTTGNALELPTAQEIMDIFFSEYEYYTPYGYYLYSGSKGIHKYMYSLNTQGTNALEQAYLDMLVPGYYGGLWCYTDEYNGEARINELRAEYLEVGDILIYLDLTLSTNDGATSQVRIVESSSVLVYLGEGNFAILDAEGNLKVASDAIYYTEAFSHDLFVCLRPSQVYEDLSAGLPSYTVTWKNHDGTVLETDTNVPFLTMPTFDGATPSKAADGVDTYIFAGWDKAVEAITGDVTYTATYARELTAHKLTDAELNLLANIKPEDVQTAFASGVLDSPNSHAVLPWVYKQVDIAVPSDFSTNKIYATLTRLFSGAKEDRTDDGINNAVYYWSLKETASDANYATMLVKNAFGGTQVNDAPTFDINYLQIGDILCAAYDKEQTKDSATHYYAYLYQGDGKFLLLNAESGVFTCDEVLSRIFTFNGTDYNWSYYFVIRPEEYGTPGNRDITLRKLTGAERYRLSKLTTMGYASRLLYGTLSDYYKAVGITLTVPKDNDANSSSMSHDRALAKLFKKVSGVYVPAEATNDLMHYFQRMLVPVYGGSLFAAADRVDISDAINNGTLLVGDVIAGTHTNVYTLDGAQKTENVPFSAMYQGNNTFLVYYYVHKDEATSASMTRTQWTTTQVESLNYLTYYTLRPENIATIHDVTWVNEDGSVLEIDKRLPFFTLPIYDGATPTKEADLYTYTFAGWDKTVERVTGDVTYTATYTYSRNLTDSKLTEEELDILASITPDDVKKSLTGTNLDSTGPWVYRQANITYSSAVGGLATVYSTATKFFSGSSNAKWTLAETVSAPYTTMLVPDSYGGTRMNTDYPAFDLNYLQVGDLFCGMYTYFTNAEETTTGNQYATYLYQGKGENGEGKFLLLNKNTAATYTLEEVLSSTYTYTDGVAYGWGLYYVIRPENCNSATRDIALRELTDAEMYALSKLDNNVVRMGSMHLHTTLPRYFQKVGITMDMKSQTHDGTLGQLFVWSSSIGGRTLVEATTDNMRYFQKMMVPCYGGTDFKEASRLTITDAITANVLQTGDVIAGKYADTEAGTTASSFTALYQGNGNFLVQYHKYDADAAAQTYQTVPMTAAQIDGLTFKYYFTLRPENLAAISDDDTFTVTWVNADGTVLETDESAVCTLPSYNGATPTKAADAQYSYEFAGWAPLLTSVNADVTYTAVYTKTVRTYTVTWVDENGTELEKDDGVPYGTIPTYDGTTPAKAATSQHTYEFAGWDKAITTVSGDVTYTAAYEAYRFLTNHKLTNEELDILANLTPEDVLGKFKYNNLDTVGPWLYKQVNIDDGDAFSKSVHGMKGTLLHSNGAYVTGNTNYNATFGPMLVTNAWGGTDYNRFELNNDALQEGDLFCSSFFGSVDGNIYYVFLYQGKGENGEGKFLHINKDDADVYTTAQVMEMTAMFTDKTTGETIEEGWTYWYVIRPENYGGMMRDLSLREMTDAEKYALSQLELTEKLCGDTDAPGVLVSNVYKEIGIDFTLNASYPKAEDYTPVTLMNLRNTLIRSSNHEALAKPYNTKYAADFAFYRPMLVDEFYGGNNFASGKAGNKAISTENLEIGDVFCAMIPAGATVGNYTFGSVYSILVLVYQGDGQFGGCMPLCKEGATNRSQDWNGLTIEQLQKLATGGEGGAGVFNFYFVIRPNQWATQSSNP